MELSPSDKSRIEKQFDHFCKMVLKNEKKDICKHNKFLLKNEKTFSELTFDEFKQMYSVGQYLGFCFKITVSGFQINIADERLFNARRALQKRIEILYYLAIGLI